MCPASEFNIKLIHFMEKNELGWISRSGFVLYIFLIIIAQTVWWKYTSYPSDFFSIYVFPSFDYFLEWLFVSCILTLTTMVVSKTIVWVIYGGEWIEMFPAKKLEVSLSFLPTIIGIIYGIMFI